MTARLPEALAPLLLEYAKLRPTRLAIHDADYLGVGDERRARDHIAGVLFHEENIVEREFRAGLAGGTVHLDDRAGRHLQLAATGLNNRVHERYLRWIVAGRSARPDPHCGPKVGAQRI